MKRVIKSILHRLKRFSYMFDGNNTIKGISLLRRLSNFVIIGSNNVVEVNSRLSKDVRITIMGNNHSLIIEKGVIFKRGQIWFEDNGCAIHIGSGTTIEEAEISVAEKGTRITIGNDCMFSKGVHISTTDSHSIISMVSGQRTNQAKDILIKNHVWLGYNVTVNKGVIIEDNSVVAGNSVVTKFVPSNVIVAGMPAKVVKTDITWGRERV